MRIANFVGNPQGMRTYVEKIRELDIGQEAIEQMKNLMCCRNEPMTLRVL